MNAALSVYGDYSGNADANAASSTALGTTVLGTAGCVFTGRSAWNYAPSTGNAGFFSAYAYLIDPGTSNRNNIGTATGTGILPVQLGMLGMMLFMVLFVLLYLL